MRVRYFSEFGNLRRVVDYLKCGGRDFAKIGVLSFPSPGTVILGRVTSLREKLLMITLN